MKLIARQAKFGDFIVLKVRGYRQRHNKHVREAYSYGMPDALYLPWDCGKMEMDNKEIKLI